MHVNEIEGVEMASYQLKDIADQWYNEWKDSKGENAEASVWSKFMEAFLD